MQVCQMDDKLAHGKEARPANRRVTVEDQEEQQTTMDLCPVCSHWNVKRDQSLKVVKVEPLEL